MKIVKGLKGSASDPPIEIHLPQGKASLIVCFSTSNARRCQTHRAAEGEAGTTRNDHEVLDGGTPISEEFTRPAIADILREAANAD